MLGFKKATWGLGSIVIVCLMAATASAGLLNTGHSYNDGTLWEGSKTFSKVDGNGTLAGRLEYAVFTAAQFASQFPSSGYTSTAGELVYTYQIFNTGTKSISFSKLLLLSGATADTAGTFLVDGQSGQAPFFSTITQGQNVSWDFSQTAAYNIVPTAHSVGLVFCSSRQPMERDIDVITNGGASVNVARVIGPGTTAIPEPSSLALLAAATAIGIAVARNRRK